jgi:hypothetical protein
MSTIAFGTPNFKRVQIYDRRDYGVLVKDYGVEAAFEDFRVTLAYWNKVVSEMTNWLVETTVTTPEDRIINIGGVSMQKVDLEFPVVESQAPEETVRELGYPLWARMGSTEFTERALAVITVEEFQSKLNVWLKADQDMWHYDIANAIFRNDNYVFLDKDDTGRNIPIKRLWNNDGTIPPVSPQGNVFNGTHNHYQVVAALNDAAVDAGYNHAREHAVGGEVVMIVNQAQTAAVYALTDFEKSRDSRIQLGVLNDKIQQQSVGDDPFDRFLGIIEDGAAVWAKPWMPAGYFAFMVIGGSLEKPLVIRQDRIQHLTTELQLFTPDEARKLNRHLSDWMVARVYGVAVRERSAMVICKIDPGLGAYTPPAIYA